MICDVHIRPGLLPATDPTVVSVKSERVSMVCLKLTFF